VIIFHRFGEKTGSILDFEKKALRQRIFDDEGRREKIKYLARQRLI
jgi:hypothetical protein